MSQFDVYANPGRNRARIPYIVSVQSSAFDDWRQRVVIPLWLYDKVREESDLPLSRVSPVFVVEGVRVVLHTLQIVSVPLSALGRKVASLAHEGDKITSALDEVFSRAFA